MQTTTTPKAQARALKEYLQENGITVSHQTSLEAVAKVMGFKNWQTYSAQKPQSAKPVAATPEVEDFPVLGVPECGLLYEVPITVDYTMTANFKVRADSTQDAIDIAREFAQTVFPRGFEVDEGNYRGAKDFYCPDRDAVEPTITLTTEDFDDNTISVANNMGMSGEFSISTTNEDYFLSAELNPEDPDNSDDDIRAKCTLTISLEYGEESEHIGTIVTKTVDYEYYGDDRARGDHLEEMFQDGELLSRLMATDNQD